MFMYTPEDLVKLREEFKLTQEQLAEKLGISRELVVKMEGGKKDISKATKILLDHFVSEQKRDISTKDNEAKVVSMQSDHDKYIRLLEKNTQHLEEHNRILREKVAQDLKTVLDNQLTLTVLFESYLKSLSTLLIQDVEQQQEFRLDLHKDAFEQLRELRKTGNHIEIDKTSIVSK